MTPPSCGLSMSPGLVQPVALAGTSLLLHRLFAMTYLVLCSQQTSQHPAERSFPHTACPLGSHEPMDFPHHRTSPSGLRLPPLYIYRAGCVPYLLLPCGSLHAEIDAMCTGEGVRPVMFYLLEPGQPQSVEPAGLAFQRLQGT